METRTINRYQMVLSAQNYLDSNNATWSAIPIMNTFKAKLDDFILGIKEEMKASGESSKGITISKNDVKEQISIKTAVLSGALSAYASVSENHDLLNNGYFSKSDIMSTRDAELPERVTNLSDLLSLHLSALADYGVTEAQVADLTSSIDDFRELIGQPRLKRSQANLAKKAVEELLESAMEVLNKQMDKVMLQFQFANTYFYEGYKKARVIVD